MGCSRLIVSPADDLVDINLILPVGLDIIGCYGASQQSCLPLVTILKQANVVLVLTEHLDAFSATGTTLTPIQLTEKEETFNTELFPLWRCQLDTSIAVPHMESTISAFSDPSLIFVTDRHMISSSSTLTCGALDERQRQTKKEKKSQKVQLPGVCLFNVIVILTSSAVYCCRYQTIETDN